MKERPILFSSPMVRALLYGTKTQTRRIVKPQPVGLNSMQARTENEFVEIAFQELEKQCPYGQPGDRLWVRETTCIAPKKFATPDDTCLKDYEGDLRYVSYKADGHCEDAMRDYKLKWTPSIHVPRWASRITLEIESIRVERLQDISEEDAKAEGCPEWAEDTHLKDRYPASAPGLPRHWYSQLWESINGPGSWEANPWVWVVTFKRIKP